nr:unnamed protein product [Spirometra erinaceieuropaei]
MLLLHQSSSHGMPSRRCCDMTRQISAATMVSKNHKHCKPRQEPRSYRVMRNQKPELAEFFESVDERMKSLAVARKPYKARNDKELTVKPGDVFEVLDDDGAWWCLRAPSGKTGHVPKYHLEPISNPMAPYGRNYDPPTDPIVVKVPVIVKTSVHKEASEEPARSRTPPARTQQQQRPVTRSASPAPASASPPPPPPPTPLSRSEQSQQQQQQQDKQPQQVFIILEPPKQEQPPEVEPPEEYQDACQTAPIQILLTPGGQFTSSMTVAPQFPQYGQAQQAAMQMCAPATIQWPCQPYYPTYV